MNYKYRVTLEGIKGFFRLYVVNGNSSLYTFHKHLRDDLEFPLDQPILFKSFDEGGAVAARYALVDLGNGTVDDVTVAQTVQAGIVKFMYFYDVLAKKYVIVTLEGEVDETVTVPVIIDSKGPLPIDFEHGYVAFEDLPAERRHLPGERPVFSGEDDENDDGEDDVDNEEDEYKEDEEVVYDENEE